MIEARVLLENPECNRDSFLAMRKDYIGASDVPAILGLVKYRSPIDVWLEKTGRGAELEDNDLLWYGREHESIVGKLFERRTGSKVEKAHAVYQHASIPWLTATPDFFYTSPQGALGALECKTTGLHARDEWSDCKAPDAAHVQLITQLAVTGLLLGSCAGMVAGSVARFYHPEFNMDHTLWNVILEKLTEFKEFVDSDTCPPARGDDLNTLEEIYTTKQGSILEVDDQDPVFNMLMSDYVEYQAANKKKTELEKALKKSKAAARQKMGENARAIFNGFEVSALTVHRAGYVVEPTSYSQMKIKEIKEK